MNRMRAILSVLAASVSLGLLVGADTSSAAVCPSVSPTDSSPDVIQGAIVCEVNLQRVLHGLQPLRSNPELVSAARGHAADMVRRRYFSHVSLGGSSFGERLRRAGYSPTGSRRWAMGENLAWGSGDEATAGWVVASWLASPGHRANMLSRRFREIGIGVAVGAPVRDGRIAITVAAEFGRR